MYGPPPGPGRPMMLWAIATLLAMVLLVVAFILILISILTANWFLLEYQNFQELNFGIFLSCYDFGANALDDCPWTRDLDDKLLNQPPINTIFTADRCIWDDATKIIDATAAMAVLGIVFTCLAFILAPAGQVLRRRIVLLLAGAVALFSAVLVIIGTIVWGAGFNQEYDCPVIDRQICDDTDLLVTECRLDWSWYLFLIAIPFLLLAGFILCLTPVRSEVVPYYKLPPPAFYGGGPPPHGHHGHPGDLDTPYRPFGMPHGGPGGHGHPMGPMGPGMMGPGGPPPGMGMW